VQCDIKVTFDSQLNEINYHLSIDEQLNLSNNRYQQLGSLNNSHDNIMLLITIIT
jgi:hypothetical protein